MIGILIVGHGRLPNELVEVAESIAGVQRQLEAISISDYQDAEELISKISSTIERIDSGDGVILLMDLFGGTCSTVCTPLLKKYKIKVISGVNLPLLLEVIFHREREDMAQVATSAQMAGIRSIVAADEILLSKRRK
jgi:PTS system mannose-specific IIA component